MPSIKAGETEKEWIARCMSHLISKEDKTKDQAAGQCFGMWRQKNEDILSKLDRLIGDAVTGGATTTGDVAKNLARGHIDVIGAGCPKGFRWSKSKKVCVKKGETNEDARSPKKGDRFINKKGKKITVVEVGSGILALAGNNIEVQFDGEKFTRDVKMTKFFKDFKFLNETIAVSGTYGNANTTIAGSQQTRAVGDKTGNEIPVLRRLPKPLRFNRLLGAYLPSAIS